MLIRLEDGYCVVFATPSNQVHRDIHLLLGRKSKDKRAHDFQMLCTHQMESPLSVVIVLIPQDGEGLPENPQIFNMACVLLLIRNSTFHLECCYCLYLPIQIVLHLFQTLI